MLGLRHFARCQVWAEKSCNSDRRKGYSYRTQEEICADWTQQGLFWFLEVQGVV